MATRTLIEPLDLSKPDNISSWFERFEQAVTMEGIQLGLDDAKTLTLKKCSFIACIGSASYEVLKSYCAPALPSTKTYDALKKTVN